MKIKRVYRKILSAFVSLVLVVSVLAQVPVKAVAESIPHYLKEVRMATAATKEEAVATLESEGFQVVDRNLREGVSGNVCYLGYKTTTDKSKAITDIRLMNAKGGINEKKYRDLVSEWKTGISTSAEYLKDACLETDENYKKGSPLAITAVSILDLFEVDGTKLSTYLFDSNRKDTDYQDILLICSDNVVATIYSALNLGTADYNTDSFATRLAKVNFNDFDYSKLAKASGNETYADYWAKSVRVIERLQEFGMDYDEALDFFAEYEEDESPEVEAEDIDEPTEQETKEFWKNFVNEKYKNSEIEEEQDMYKYANIIGLYEKLSKYSLPNSKYENLAEYIYTCGDPFDEDGEETDNITYRIYPLVSALTKGQIFTLQYGGVSALVSALDANTEENKETALSAVDELKAKIKELGLERISVFYNVNRNIYDQTIAFTNEAERVGTASSSFDKLVKKTEDDNLTKALTNIILIGGMVAGSFLVVAVLTLGITAAIAGTTMATLVNVGVIALISGSIGVASGGMTMSIGAVVAGVVGTVAIVIALVILAIIVICVIIAIFKAIFDDDEEEDVLPNKPNVIFDVVGSQFTEYSAVTDKKGNPIDITCGNGKEWDVMYVSYSDEAGKPIVTDDNAFIFQTDTDTPPENYTPVSRFGYIDTANLNSFEGNSKAPLYMFYQGTPRDGDSGQKYLADIMLSAEKTAEAARLGIIKMGFTPVEQNLTPNTEKVSYIGYKTTSNANDAITDIRVANYYSAKSFLYGNKSDGSAVEYALVGELVTKTSIYYTRQKSNGSAIIADFKFSKTKLSADSGYEPVIMFSGGECYNFYIGCNENNGIRLMKDGVWNNTFYMYFKPSITFTSKDPEYISGFAFSSGYYDNLSFAAQNGFKAVPNISGHNLSDGATQCPTYMLYSTTHNPYRAITEISSYTASSSAEGLFENMSLAGVGYAACETFACVCDEGFFSDDYYRLLRPSNAFITRQSYEGADFEDLATSIKAINNFGIYENTPIMGLYVAGPDSSKTPLTMDDINFCTDKDTAGRTAFVNEKGETVFCKPVHDITDCYANCATNLTFEWDYEIRTSHDDVDTLLYQPIVFKNYLRIFYRGSVAKRGKYVSGITVATIEPTEDNEEKYSYDQAMVKLLSKGEGEIIKVNLTRSYGAQPRVAQQYTIGGETFDLYRYNYYEGASTYIMVQYTDYLMESLRTATTKWYGNSTETIATKLDHQGTRFDYTGDKVKGISGNYAIYTSKNGQLGSPVTDIVLDTDYLKPDCTTVSCSDNVCRTGEDYVIKLKQLTDSTAQSYIKNLVYASCGSRQDCISELYSKGCTAFIDQNKNANLGGNCIYFGYSTTVDESDSDILTGIEIQCKSSKSHDSQYTTSDGLVYDCISGDLNKGVGGDYTYLYVTKTKKADPITQLSTSTVMSSSLSKYKEYKTRDWVTTNNASSGTNGTFKLCFRRKSTGWSINQYGLLSITLEGDMKNYKKEMLLFYTKPGAMGAMKCTVSYLPDWCDYGDAITDVAVYSKCTLIDDVAFCECPNIETVTVHNRDCVIQDGAIPDGVTVRGYDGSTADTYAQEHGLKFIYFRAINGRVGTVIGSSNAVAVIVITAILVLCGGTALVVARKRKKAKKNEDKVDEK